MQENVQEIPIHALTKSTYFTQTSVWEQLKHSTGWSAHAFQQIIYPAIEQQYVVYVKAIPFLGHFTYIPNGLLSLDDFSSMQVLTSSLFMTENKARLDRLRSHIIQSLKILSTTHRLLQEYYGYKLISIRWDIPTIIEMDLSIATTYQPQMLFKNIQKNFSSNYISAHKSIHYRIQLQETTQAPATVLIHLTKMNHQGQRKAKTNKDLFLGYKKKTRYNIRLAEKKNVEIKKDIPLEDFYTLLLITSNRNKIAIHSLDYFKTLEKAVENDKTMHLQIYGAYIHLELVSAVIVLYHYNTEKDKIRGEEYFTSQETHYSTPDPSDVSDELPSTPDNGDSNDDMNTSTENIYQENYDTEKHIETIEKDEESKNDGMGTSTYLYGASSNTYREYMPSYLIQWHAILDARDHNCKLYDMYGISQGKNSDKASKNRLDGLYRFKTGFAKSAWTRPCAIDIFERSFRGNIRKIFFDILNKIRLWYYHYFSKRCIPTKKHKKIDTK